jgi:hypothetical protein
LTNKGVKTLREKLRGLGVGTQGPWKLFGKSFDPEKPINDVAGRGVICLKRWQIGLKTDKLRSKTVAEIGQWVGLPTFESQQRLSALDKQVFKLPRFCKKTWKGWAKLLWKLVLIDTKDEPEKHPFWAQAGAYRKRWHDLRIKSKERDQAKNRAVLAKLNISSLPKKASRPCPPSIIRNGARTALFQAIRIIAPAK